MKKLTLLFAALLAVSMSFATTVTKTVNQLVTENEWTVSAGNDIGTLATNFALDNVITVSTTGTPNCGSIWGTTTNDWRLYQNQNGNVTITAAEGYTLSIVKLTFNVAKTGVLLDAAGNTVASNSEIEVNAQNVTFTVGNSSTATNGQVKITAFEVTYLAVGDSTIIPVDTTIVPVDTTIVPVDTTIVPVDTTIVPVVIDTTEVTCSEASTIALALDHNTPSTGIYAVTGYITEVVGNVSRNQQTFWMADTLEGGHVFEGYWANLPEGVEAFVEGMQIRMTGNLMRYNSTPEMKNGTVEILAMPVVPDDTTIIPVDTTIVPVDTIALNCADARTLALTLEHNTPTQQIYAVTGFITEVPGTPMNTHQQTFWMADTLEGGRVFEGYKAYLPAGVDAFEVGMQVRLIGKLMKYNTTPEISEGNVEILALPVIPADTDSIIVPPVVETVPLTFNAGMWNTAGAKFAAWVWGGNLEDQFTDFFVPGNDSNIYLAQIPANADSILFVRFANTVETPSWQDTVWNQTADYGIMKSDMYFTITDWTSGVWGTPEPVIETVTIAEALQEDLGTDVTTIGIVTYINGKNAYIQDANNGILLFNRSANLTGFAVGDEIIIDGKVATYGNAPELSDVVLRQVVSSGNTVEAIPMTLAERVANPLQNFGMMIYIENLTITSIDSYRNPTLSDGENSIVCYKMSVDTAVFHIGDVVDVTAIAGYYNAIQFQGNVNGIVKREIPTPVPTEVVFFDASLWNTADAKFAAWVWGDSLNGMWTNFFLAANDTTNEKMANIYLAEIPVTADSIIFVRFANTVTEPTWDNQAANIWNRIADQSINWEIMFFTVTDWSEGIWGQPVPEPVFYFIKNNWDGFAEWTWQAMEEDTLTNLWEYTGVYGGQGVNINTKPEDSEDNLWFPEDAWLLVDSIIPQAFDTLQFIYSPEDTTLLVHFVGRPAAEPVHYYIQNNWNGGEEWFWADMTQSAQAENIYVYMGVFGGTGVDINSNYMDSARWYPVENWILMDSTWVPQAMDTIAFEFNAENYILTATLVGRPVPAPEVFQIKNNWNGGEWAWMDMEAALAPHDYLWFYVGVFGGTGVNITSNYMDTVLWFPVENWILADSGWTPAPMDTIAFEFNAQDTIMTAMLVGRPAPAPLTYSIKNNWDGGNWTWVEMTQSELFDYQYEYTGVFGGTGVNIKHNMMSDDDAFWFPVEDFDVAIDSLVPQAGDTVYFNFNSADTTLFAMVMGRPAPFVYNTCADVNAITENTDITLGEVTVVFAKNSNIYVQDATATTLIYTNQYSALKPGDRVRGIAGQATLYNGLPELKPNTAFADLQVTEGTAPRIPNAPGAPTKDDVNKVMMFRNVQMLDTAFTTPGNKAMNINGIYLGDTVIFRNNWKDTYTFEEGKTYSMLGCVAIYNGTIQVYVTDIQEYVPANYYIKNNWDGGDWTWGEMTQSEMFDYQYEYTGVFGGTGVNINTAAADEGSIWFPIENFDIDIEGLVPQAGDTVYFNFNSFDETLYAYVVGRPEVITVQYFIKNNWNGGEWTWEIMTPADDENITWMYQGVFGGTGVNINTAASDANAQWFPVDQWIITTLGYEPAAGDEILFEYDSEENTLTATFMGEDGIETITFQREGETTKVIRNGQLYIIRDGKMYNALGAQVR